MQKLKGLIVERNTTQEAVARLVGIDRSTFYRKMKFNGLSFSIEEAQQISNILNLSREEMMDIFLAHE